LPDHTLLLALASLAVLAAGGPGDRGAPRAIGPDERFSYRDVDPAFWAETETHRALDPYQEILQTHRDRKAPDLADTAATTVVVLFALWGLQQLLMGFLYVAVLVRYRALLALMYLLPPFEYAGRLCLGLWKGPIETLSTPPGAGFNGAMIEIASVMWVLGLRGSDERTA